MASLALLPSEILLHILRLSNEGETDRRQQRARFSFGLMSRACFLATADATEFHVGGDLQAQRLISKLEREKAWVAQEEHQAQSGRTTRSTFARVTTIRRLSLLLDYNKGGKAIGALLCATPNLIKLEVGAFWSRQTHYSDTARSASLIQLEDAAGGLADLRELQIRSHFFETDSLLRILIPLKQLEVLDVSMVRHFVEGEDSAHLLTQLTLSRVRDVRISLETYPLAFSNALLAALTASSTSRIQVLDLGSTQFDHQSLKVVESLTPVVATLVHFRWAPWTGWIEELEDARDAVLTLLGAMKCLEYLSITMWTLPSDADTLDSKPIDPKLFETLATLPSLHSVSLVVKTGDLDEDHLRSFIKSHHTLRSLTILFSRGGWTREQRGRVQVAGQEAGVAFLYEDLA